MREEELLAKTKRGWLLRIVQMYSVIAKSQNTSEKNLAFSFKLANLVTYAEKIFVP